MCKRRPAFATHPKHHPGPYSRKALQQRRCHLRRSSPDLRPSTVNVLLIRPMRRQSSTATHEPPLRVPGELLGDSSRDPAAKSFTLHAQKHNVRQVCAIQPRGLRSKSAMPLPGPHSITAAMMALHCATSRSCAQAHSTHRQRCLAQFHAVFCDTETDFACEVRRTRQDTTSVAVCQPAPDIKLYAKRSASAAMPCTCLHNNKHS